MDCQHCGNGLSSDAKFCGSCGNPVHIEGTRGLLCPRCSAALVTAAQYCEACGADKQATPFGVPIGDVGAWRGVFNEMGWCTHLQNPKGNAWPLMKARGVRVEDPDEPWIISLTPPYKTAAGFKMGHSPSPGEPRGTSVEQPGRPSRQAIVVIFRRSRLSLLLHERMRLTSSEYSLLDLLYSDLTGYRYDSSGRIEVAGPQGLVFALTFRPPVSSTKKAFNGLLRWANLAAGLSASTPGETFIARQNVDIIAAGEQQALESEVAFASVIRAFLELVTSESRSSSPTWYSDPYWRHEYRLWDGTSWTDHVSTRGAEAIDPI